jgi:hypothetical protein
MTFKFERSYFGPKTALEESHTSADFVDFLGEVVSQCRPKQEIHIILDNLSAHKTQAVPELGGLVMKGSRREAGRMDHWRTTRPGPLSS